MTESKDRRSFLDKDYTRRQFLKLSGKSLAGLALSTSLLSVLGVSEQAVAEDKVRVWAFPQGLLVVNSYISRVKVTRNLFSSRNGAGLYTEDSWTYFPDTCRQCEKPACGEACPMGAIYADESGIKRVDTNKCVGCGMCTEACPWHMPTVNPATQKSSKCIMCGACAEGCPSGALSIVPWDQITAVSQLV